MPGGLLVDSLNMVLDRDNRRPLGVNTPAILDGVSRGATSAIEVVAD